MEEDELERGVQVRELLERYRREDRRTRRLYLLMDAVLFAVNFSLGLLDESWRWSLFVSVCWMVPFVAFSLYLTRPTKLEELFPEDFDHG